jgi:outer membrane receptor protein involved in Fe transport
VVPGDINFQPQFVETPDGGLEEVPSPGSIAIAETDPARALNVFGDGRTTEPNDIELLRSVLGDDEYRETSENWTASFQADGTLLELPSGALKMAVGGEYRREQVDFHKFNTTGTEILSLDEGAKRDVSAAFVEFSVPLIGEQQQIGAVRSLLLSLAGRLDSESVFGEEFTPKVGLMWKPVRSLALRATYGHGYKVPTLQQLFEPDITRPSFFFFPIPVDPVTGANIDYQIDIREGGNLDLMPEESTSWSAGIILEPVALPGLSVSVDYFDIDYTNRVSIVDSQAILEYFPERVQRDPDTNLPTLIDARAVNLAASRARGVDVRLVHRVSTAAHGSFDTRFNYTYNITNTLRSTPDSAEFENVDNLFLPRVRANMDLFWLRNGLEIGPTVRYEASTMNSLPFGATAPVRVANAIVVDLHASFDFDEHQSAVNSRWKNGLKLSIGVNNLFDRPPSSTNGAGGYAKVDPRQRRYYFTLQKSF